MPPPPPSVTVAGRYSGVVAVLADLLRADGIEVGSAAALDAVGRPGVEEALAVRGVLVVTAAMGDPTAGLIPPGRDPSSVVAVTWHPPDELPPLPRAVRIVRAGRIGADLPAAVRTALVSWS